MKFHELKPGAIVRVVYVGDESLCRIIEQNTTSLNDLSSEYCVYLVEEVGCKPPLLPKRESYYRRWLVDDVDYIDAILADT